jgi:poly(beta-D-mannuronate) lyase
MVLIAYTDKNAETILDTAPSWSSTPAPIFKIGLPDTYDLNQDLSDDGLSVITYAISGSLPSGVIFDPETGILNYDGVGGVTTTGHTATVQDAIGNATTSTFSNRGGTSIPASNTRYWDKPVYPVYDSGDGTHSLVTTKAALQTAIDAASPGDTIFLQDGTYNDFSLNVTTNGTSGSPITIAAQTKGGVIFTGTPTLDFTSDYINIYGFTVTGTTDGNGEVHFEGTGANDCVFAYLTFTNQSTGGNNRVFWVQFNGSRNRVCYCTMEDKSSGRSPVSTDGGSYHRVDHNRFLNIWGDGTNGDAEVVQFLQAAHGTDHLSLMDNNYIYRYNNVNGNKYVSEEREIVANKSSENMFIQNVLVECIGALNDRHASRSTYYANWIDGGDIVGSAGIMLGGTDSYAFCNYITNINPGSTQAGIGMREGDGGTNYFKSVDNEGSFNTIMLSAQSLAYGIGGGGNNLPTGCLTYNTAVDWAIAPSVYQDNYVSATFGGCVFKSPVGIAGPPSGINDTAPELVLDNGYYVPIANGNCNDTGSFNFNSLITVDILGNSVPNTSPNNPNVGCFQDGWDFTIDPKQRIIDEAGA